MLEKWQEAMRNKERFYQECVGDSDGDGKGATYFETNAGPYIEEVEQALSEYEQLKRQIRNYEAAIYEYQEVHSKVEVVHLTPGLLGLGVLCSSHAYEMYCETYD